MLKFEHPNGRFYYIQYYRDMFDDVCVMVIRGGYNQRVVRTISCGVDSELQATVNRITKKRLRRGYILLS